MTLNFATDPVYSNEAIGFPVALVTLSDDLISKELTADQAFEGRIEGLPVISQSELALHYGIAGFDAVTLTVSNADGAINGIDLVGKHARVWFKNEDGEVHKSYSGIVASFSLGIQCRIVIRHEAVVALEKQLPSRTVREAAGISEAEHLGNTSDRISIVFGRALKIPLRPIREAAPPNTWISPPQEAPHRFFYAVHEGYDSRDFKIYTVYNEDVALLEERGENLSWTFKGKDRIEATLDPQHSRPDGYYVGWFLSLPGKGDIYCIESSRGRVVEGMLVYGNNWIPPLSDKNYEIKQFGRTYTQAAGLKMTSIETCKRFGDRGRLNTLYASVQGWQLNPVQAIEKILTDKIWGLGLDVDTSSFSTAATLPDIAKLKFEGAQIHPVRPIDIIEEAMAFRDIVLSSGENGIKVNVPTLKTSKLVLGYRDDNGADNILNTPQIEYTPMNERVGAINARYRRDNSLNDTYQQIIRREVPGGGGSAPDMEIDLRFVYDHETADRIVDFRRKRIAAANRRVSIHVGKEASDVNVGDVVTLDIPSLGENGDWEVVASKHRIAGTQELTLVPYSADAFTYSPPAQLPVDKQFDIPPDYENTPPAPVANLAATLSISTSGEGITAWIDLSWNPPERNYGGAVVEMKRATEDLSAYREVGTYKGSSVRISEGVMPNVGFDFRVHALNRTGQIRGLASTNTTNVKVATINPPTNLLSTSSIEQISWTWDNSASQDIVRHEIEILTDKTGGSRVTLQSFYKGANPVFNLTANAGVTRYARVRAIHASGTASDWTALVAGIAGSVPEVEIPETVITEARAGLDTTNNLNNLKDGTIYNYPSDATGAPNRVPGMIMTFAGATRQFATQFWDGKTYYREKEKNDKNQWRPWEYKTGIARGAITAKEIQDGSVSTPKLSSNSVTADKISAGAITATEIQDGSVSTPKLSSNAVTADKISAGAITATEIQDGSISTPKLNSNSVTADKISAGAVTALQINAGAVTSSKIGANQVLAEHIQADAITASHMSSGSIDLGSATVKGTLRAGNIDSNVRNATLLFSANILSNRFPYYRDNREQRFNAPYIERSVWTRIRLKAPWKSGSNFTARFDSLLICVAFFSSGNVYIGSIEVPTNSILNYINYDRRNIKIGEFSYKRWQGTGVDKVQVTGWKAITKQLVYVPASTAENAEFDIAIAANPSLDWSIYMQRVRLDSDSKEGVILQIIGMRTP